MKNCNSILKFNKYIVNKVYLVNNENYKENNTTFILILGLLLHII